ncbi:venom carboxylesterase-6-like, partial [Asbolus verrucosus]
MAISKAVIITTAFLQFGFADILVNLPDGTIRGKESITIANKTFYSFLKVPYASPPTGNLRFKPPVPPKRWTGILNATEHYVICYQVNRDLAIESEDCLYLNIYTPRLPNDSEIPTFPVMLYIHGGGFIQGTCLNFICGPEFLIEYDVVVVTVNYRLGPFGFLSTQDEVIPGNNGLKDQHLAIKWTHDNIQLFGGDPERITILGQSAGSASVTYQFLNKKSEGLFWGAICESGSFLSPWSFQRRAREIAFKTASFINETFNYNNDSEDLYRFLRDLPAEELDEASFRLHQLENLENRQISQGYFYSPVIEPEHDDAFITGKMYSDLESGNFIKVPILIGITSEESIEEAGDLSLLQETMKTYDENLHWLVPDDMNIKDEEKRKMVGSIIRSLYSESNFEQNLAAGIRFFSDNSFTRSVIKHAELQSKFTDVYFYQFSYDGMLGNISTALKGADKVAHSEETRYIWRIVFEGYDNTDVQTFPETDILIQRRMLKLWTDFAKTLNPTPKKSDLLQNITWPTVASGRPKDFLFLDIKVLVELPAGTILGRESESYTGKPYYIFQKIPYAAPPAPTPPNNWDGILNTTFLDAICYQISTDLPEETEDCLYINVYTPELPSENNNVSIPVLLYIYGGGFYEGHSMQYRRGPEFLIDHDVVVVTFNYRLGPLGFISTEDAIIPGNNGLRDQQLAIKWVHENIRLFGGDPEKITIVGESAGGASVSHQLLNKNSEGLFRGAIMESGTAINPSALQRNARTVAFSFGAVLNETFHTVDDSQTLLDYLLTVSAEDLDKASTLISGWAPVIEVEHDEAFITEKMYGIVKSGNFVKVPVLMGINSEESLYEAGNLDTLKAKMVSYDNNVELLVPVDMRISNIENQKEFGEAIRKIYCGDETFTDNLAAGVRFDSDNSFTRAIIKNAELQSKFTDVYFYQFSYDGIMGNVTVDIDGAEHVAHAEELRYVWRTTRDGYDNSDLSKFPPEDVTTLHRMLTLWTNFVKTLNPTPEKIDLLQNVTWPIVTSGEEGDFIYLDIGLDLEVKSHPKQEAYSGIIKGRIATIPQKKSIFYAFQEIPYAAPPVGELRFQPPQPVPAWKGVLDTTHNSKVCYQVGIDSDQESEDCLYLNVYSPKLQTRDGNISLPVMVFIHGGGFIVGDAILRSYGPEFLVSQGVVIVTLNYRLGVFGFLSTQDEIIPGNNGLKDQLFALQWVNKNIHLFGGDPAKVTIFGQSAGAASVGYHLISPKSQGLYRAAIMESGSSISAFAYQRNARHYGFKTASLIYSNINENSTSEELLEAMLKASAADIDQASHNVTSQEHVDTAQLFQGYYYAPVIELDSEDAFLTEKMFEVISRGDASKVPIIIGINSEESLSQNTDTNVLKRIMTQYDKHLDFLVPNDMNIKSKDIKIQVGGTIRRLYSGDDLLQNVDAAGVRYMSDTSFTRSVIKHAIIQSNYSDVYFYQFSYDGLMGNVSVIIDGTERVGHNEENGYLWRVINGQFNNYNLDIYPNSDIVTQKRLLTLWTNFAKTLNPTPEKLELLQNIIWPVVSLDDNFPYLDIGEDLVIKHNPKEAPFAVWDALYE